MTQLTGSSSFSRSDALVIVTLLMISTLFILRFKEGKKEELFGVIKLILVSGLPVSGHAGELKGKLMLAASQLWVKFGRAFLLAISVRQFYMPTSKDHGIPLGKAQEHSPWQWSRLLESGPSRQLLRAAPSRTDIVLLTDGPFPDPRRSETGPARVGAVFFDRRRLLPAQFSEVVTNDVLNTWIPRATQIFVVVLVAIVLALETFRFCIRDAMVLLLVDAEAVGGALVKGWLGWIELQARWISVVHIVDRAWGSV